MAILLSFAARWRHVEPDGAGVVALRWDPDPVYRFPTGGFALEIERDGVRTTLVSALSLPGARQVGGYWRIEDLDLEADRAARDVSPGHGRYDVLPDAAEALALKPMLTFVLPYPDPAELALHLPSVAESLDMGHKGDPYLAQTYWPTSPAPEIDAIVAMATSSDAYEQAVYSEVTRWYRESAYTWLSALARRFGMARFLGLAFNDIQPAGSWPATWIRYRLFADYGFPVRSGPKIPGPPNSRYPRPPLDLALTEGRSLVGYPAFKPFFEPSGWAETAPNPGDAILRKLHEAAQRGPRFYPSPTAQLSWAAVEDDPPDGAPARLDTGVEPDEDESGSDEDHDDQAQAQARPKAALWKIERLSLGAGPTDGSEPPIDPAAIYDICHDGEAVLAGALNQFEDDRAMPWGQVPLDGWYAYRVTGIDIFGIAGLPGDPVLHRFRDTIGPPPPRLSGPDATIGLEGAPADFPLSIHWDAIQEYEAPDAEFFRIRQVWTPQGLAGVRVVSARPVSGALGILQAIVELRGSANVVLPDADLDRYARGKLMTADGEYEILGRETSGVSQVRVRRSGGRLPPPGPASLQFLEPSIETASEVEIRKLAVAVKITLVSLAPFVVSLTSLDPAAVIADTSTLAIHLLDIALPYQLAPGGAGFLLSEPSDPNGKAARLVAHLRTLGLAQVAAFFDESPALALPGHEVMIRLAPPPAFVTGSLEVRVSAVDTARDVTDPSFAGNEGEPATLTRIAISRVVPATINVRPPMIWARAAAAFVDEAEVRLTWPEVPGAGWYEVGRLLVTALGLGSNASDDDLLDLGAAELAAEVPRYERRTSGAPLNEYIDRLAGGSPARALYSARAVTAAGIAGPWALVALVRVPDIRVPPVPNFLTVRPAGDRALELQWIAAGPLQGFGFRVEARIPAANRHEDDDWSTVAEFAPTTLTPRPGGRFIASLGGRPAGLLMEYRLVGVRYALDPDDPRAKSIRQIAGRPSPRLAVRAGGELVPPADLRANAKTVVELRWRNRDAYVSIEVRRRDPGSHGYRRFPVQGGHEHYREAEKLAPGTYVYEVAAIGHGRRAKSETLIVEVTP